MPLTQTVQRLILKGITGNIFLKKAPFILQENTMFAYPSTQQNEGSSAFGSSPAVDSPSLTQKFVSTFTDTVKHSEVLTDVFEVSQTTPTDFRKFMYDYVKASATNLGMDSPHTIAETAARAVEDHFETLIPSVMVKVFANTAAKYLQSEGLLSSINVATLAESYATALTGIAKKNVHQVNPGTKLKALMDGIEKFFTSVDLLVADKGQTIASTFANEVRLAGLELRQGGNFYAVN